MTDTPPAEPRASDGGASNPGDDHLLDHGSELPQPTAVSATPVPQSAGGSPDGDGGLEPNRSPDADGSPESDGDPSSGDGKGDIETAAETAALGGRRGRARMLALLAAVIAVMLIATTLVGGRVLGWWGTTGTPTAEPSPSPSPTQMVDPFAGTPAEDFPEGADGIVLPEPEPIGDFTAEEVAEALEQVREALIAARLDHTMLIDHNPEPFLSLLALDHRGGREKEFDDGSFSAYASQISSDFDVLEIGPRVVGEVGYASASPGGAELMEVTTRFVWVYPLTSADQSTDLVIVHDELVWSVRGERWEPSSQGLWLAEEVALLWGATCSVYETGMIIPSSEVAITPGSDGSEEVFSLKKVVEGTGDC